MILRHLVFYRSQARHAAHCDTQMYLSAVSIVRKVCRHIQTRQNARVVFTLGNGTGVGEHKTNQGQKEKNERAPAGIEPEATACQAQARSTFSRCLIKFACVERLGLQL